MCAAQQGAESPAAQGGARWSVHVCSPAQSLTSSGILVDLSHRQEFRSHPMEVHLTIEGHIWWGYSLKFRPLHRPYGRYLQ